MTKKDDPTISYRHVRLIKRLTGRKILNVVVTTPSPNVDVG